MTDELNGRRERRRFIRVSIYAITRYVCPFRDMEVGVQARISDISEGGALLVTSAEGVPVKTPVKISFVLPGEPGLLINVDGIVRHSGTLSKDLFRSGIEFLRVNENGKKALLAYIAANIKNKSEEKKSPGHTDR